jgi:glyoxylase-like metal-dependent hydrolase (beta-lactamase superfamily II)
MIVESTRHPAWLSNSYLVADRPGGHAFIVDGGGPSGPLLERIEREKLSLTHLLCTHHHADHVAHNADYVSRFGCPVCGHVAERRGFGSLDLELNDGDELDAGELRVRVLHVPGHTVGQLAFLVNGKELFTGDTLFRRTVGGTRAPGHARFEDLQRSIMEVLMRLPAETVVRPGHMEPTTIGEEWEENPFIRAWRGLDPVRESRCAAYGQPATLLLRAPDYDGGTKCWVRFDRTEEQAVVPGSQVRDA